jgi:hypothetical protein
VYSAIAIAIALVASSAALAVGDIAQVAIIDRDTGVALTPHFNRGEYWVAGRPGATYAIDIRNRLGERLLAVVSVDGVNVISGATAGWDQVGYVFDPSQSYEISGWRKTDTEVAAFTFTDSANSYAERTGRPANVGVIGVALFRERRPQLTYAPPVIGDSPDRRVYPPPQPAPAPAPTLPVPSEKPAPPPLASAAPKSDSTALSNSSAGEPPPARSSIAPVVPRTPKLGTGHGEREFSYVTHTEFLRRQPHPNEVIRIRYDSLENLIAMGIIKGPHLPPWATNPFPASTEPQYVPDPPERDTGELP